MATSMKAWLVTVIALCSLVAMWALPPRRVTDHRWGDDSPEQTRFRELAEEVQATHGALIARRWSDSISALVVDSAVDGLTLAHPPSEFVTEEGYREWRSTVAAWLESRPVRDPDMTVGIVFQPDLHGALEGVPGPLFGLRPQIYTGVRDGTPYCFVVLPGRYQLTNAGLRSAWMPEQCDWYAKYGAPGNAIGAWLESGGLAFAKVLPRREDLDAILESRLPDFSVPFGLLRPTDEPITAVACLAGRTNACERAVIDPAWLAFPAGSFRRIVEQSPMLHVNTGTSSAFRTASSFLLSEVESTYGTEAFARFWKSDQPVSAAFESAFGTDLGTWVRDFATDHLGSYRGGPAPRRASVGWSMLTVLLLSALASLRQTRRRVS